MSHNILPIDPLRRKSNEASKRGFVNITVIVLIIAIAGLAGYLITTAYMPNLIPVPTPKPVACTQEAKQCPDGSYVGRTGSSCEFAECLEKTVNFGDVLTFAVEEEMRFTDGLTVSLIEINDSRCLSGVVCVWAGELSPLFRVMDENTSKSPKEIRLGTVIAASATLDGFTFLLKEATAITATIVVTQGGEKISLHEGEKESSFLLEKIYPDRVTGLNFWEYPIATDKGHPVTLRVGEIASNGCTIALTLTRIEGNTATFTKKTDFNRPCPICLAGDTLIDTLFGPLPVKYLWRGAPIWTSDKAGHSIAGIIMETTKTPVPPQHQMVHLVLDDERELFVSPGHPTIDGRTVGELLPGDFYDGASVLSAKGVPYNEDATYDVLPSGETGFYWANSILLGSTLRDK